MLRLTSANRIVGLLALLLWLQLLVALYPLPPQAAQEFLASLNQSADPEVERAFWHQWFENLVLLIAGVGASCMAFWNLRYWRPAILMTSGIVAGTVGAAVVSDVFDRGGMSQWWQLWQTVTERFIERGEGGFVALRIYHLLIWPALHLVLMAVVSCLWVIQVSVSRALS